MSACTFFGHRNCPDTIKQPLKDILTDLVTTKGVDVFYVGNQGHFDYVVREVLRELENEYSHVRSAVVLAYMPKENDNGDYSNTMLPEGIENVPKRFAISWRNKWMLKQANYVVTYVAHSWGGAAQFADIAKRQNKTVINLAGSDG